MHLLHPIMPFVTEELWQQLGPKDAAMLITAPWPEADAALMDRDAAAEMDWVVRLISEVRAVRAEMNVPAAAKIDMIVCEASDTAKARLRNHHDQIFRLARLNGVTLDGAVPKGAVQALVDEATVVLPLAGVIDLDRERARLERELAKLAGDMDVIDRKLANSGFLAKAPPEVVDTQRERRADAEAAHAKLAAALERL